MKDQTTWRARSSDEADAIRSILSKADVSRSGPLLADLDAALVTNETPWILDVTVSNSREGADLPNRPFPAEAFVSNCCGLEKKEYDTHAYTPRVRRGPDRIVVDSDGSRYFTSDHYETFVKF